MMELLETALVAIVTGAVSGGLTLAAIKNDVSWIKHSLSQQHDRITFLERKVE